MHRCLRIEQHEAWSYLKCGIGGHEFGILGCQVLLPEEGVFVKGCQVLSDDCLGALNAASEQQQHQGDALVTGYHVEVCGRPIGLGRHDRQLLCALQHLQHIDDHVCQLLDQTIDQSFVDQSIV